MLCTGLPVIFFAVYCASRKWFHYCCVYWAASNSSVIALCMELAIGDILTVLYTGLPVFSLLFWQWAVSLLSVDCSASDCLTGDAHVLVCTCSFQLILHCLLVRPPQTQTVVGYLISPDELYVPNLEMFHWNFSKLTCHTSLIPSTDFRTPLGTSKKSLGGGTSHFSVIIFIWCQFFGSQIMHLLKKKLLNCLDAYSDFFVCVSCAGPFISQSHGCHPHQSVAQRLGLLSHCPPSLVRGDHRQGASYAQKSK